MTISEKRQIKFSIVIAAWNGNDYLRDCLKSLEKQIDEQTEIIVAHNFQSGVDECKRLFPFAKFILLPEATVPGLRTAGIHAANGAIIALVEDHCAFDPLWSQEIQKAHESAFAIVGGTVENASTNRALNWAVYLYDYGNYRLPARAGATATLSGINVSYKREILHEVREIYANGFFETFVNEELKGLGHNLYLAPAAVVYHRKNYDFKIVASQFYHQARSFAALRIVKLPFSRRVSFMFGSLLLPILLPARVASQALKKKRHLGKLLTAFPSLMILLTIWAAGEFCGYSFGAGASARHWR